MLLWGEEERKRGRKEEQRRMQARRGARRGRGSDYLCEIQQDHSLCSEGEGNYLVIFNSQSFMLIISSHPRRVRFPISFGEIFRRVRGSSRRGGVGKRKI